jgi:hypothetical protein
LTSSFILYTTIQSFFFIFSVPTEDPSGNSVILPRYEFFRICQNSKVITKEEREMREQRMKEEKERAMVCHYCLKFSSKKLHIDDTCIFSGSVRRN